MRVVRQQFLGEKVWAKGAQYGDRLDGAGWSS